MRQHFVLHHNLGGVRAAACLLLAHRLLAQRELESVTGGFESGILQGTFKARGVATQQIESVGTVDGQTRSHVAIAVDVEPDLDAAELWRIKADFKAVFAGNCSAGDFDRESSKRDSRRQYSRLCNGRRGRRRGRACARGLSDHGRSRRSIGRDAWGRASGTAGKRR